MPLIQKDKNAPNCMTMVNNINKSILKKIYPLYIIAVTNSCSTSTISSEEKQFTFLYMQLFIFINEKMHCQHMLLINKYLIIQIMHPAVFVFF